MRELRPDCVVLDFHLEDGDASAVCGEIRGDAVLGVTPILIFSSDPEVESEAYLECRADRFIRKGASVMSCLCKAIEEVLSPPSAEPAGP